MAERGNVTVYKANISGQSSAADGKPTDGCPTSITKSVEKFLLLYLLV